MKNETNTIKFRHAYYKLAKPEFTTIRGKAQYKKLAVGDPVNIETPGGNFTGTITKLELKRVEDMPIEFLRLDAEYPGYAINSHNDFIALLNSFRSPAWAQVKSDTELTIITIKKD